MKVYLLEYVSYPNLLKYWEILNNFPIGTNGKLMVLGVQTKNIRVLTFHQQLTNPEIWKIPFWKQWVSKKKSHKGKTVQIQETHYEPSYPDLHCLQRFEMSLKSFGSNQ